MRLSTLSLGLTAALASVVSGHTAFTTLFINDVSQGDGTCVCMAMDGETCTFPIAGLTSDDMACGRDGNSPVPYICPAPPSAKLTFLFRAYPDASQPGFLDPSHKGPCAVYVKQVADMFSTPATGSGWFKIWDSGYDDARGKWCTEKLMDQNGLLSVNLPSGLPAGYYLVRPELLALQQVYVGDPQYYVGCAQIFIDQGEVGTISIPAENEVSIPGYINRTEPGNTFKIYEPVFPYPVPGPKPYSPTGTPSSTPQTQDKGVIPASCILKNVNWCAVEVPSYSDEVGCWAASDACYGQADECYGGATPAGVRNCDVWLRKCEGIQRACEAGDFKGPPGKGQKLQGAPENVPGAPPPAEGVEGGSPAVVGVAAVEETTGGTGEAGSGAEDVDAGSPIDDESISDPESEAEPGVAKSNIEDTQAASPVEDDPPSGSDSQADNEGQSPPTSEATPETEQPSSGENPAPNASTDGTCGGPSGQTCRGSSFGSCCSADGQCGSTKAHCRTRCQQEFGRCRTKKNHGGQNASGCGIKH